MSSSPVEKQGRRLGDGMTESWGVVASNAGKGYASRLIPTRWVQDLWDGTRRVAMPPSAAPSFSIAQHLHKLIREMGSQTCDIWTIG